jgi:hypothetical protein
VLTSLRVHRGGHRQHPRLTVLRLDVLGQPVELLLQVFSEGQQRCTRSQAGCTQQHDLTPESRGLLAIAHGFSAAYADDHEQPAAELPVYDALHAWCRIQIPSKE